MRKSINFKGIEVSYTDHGSGACIFLLHGYLESGEIWEDFVPLLAGQYRVISLDIPGHGRSGSWGKEHSIADLADSVEIVLEREDIHKVILVGHSMGGYICMEFASRHPEKLAGYVLFHSTCFADNAEKKANRDREISLILCGRKQQIINVNIPKAFADINVDRLESKLKRCQEIAHSNGDKGTMALLNGMKMRADHSATLADSSLPLLLIGGEGDNYIPGEVFDRLLQMAPHASYVRLKESGHMGFIEEAEPAAKVLLEFSSGLFP